MPKVDNKLSGASNLGVLGATPLGLTDKFKPTDTETLYRFGLSKSSFNSLIGTGEAINASETRGERRQSLIKPKGKDRKVPKAGLGVLSPVISGNSTYEFVVTYTDNKAIKANSIDNNDVRVSGSNGYSQLAKRLTAVASGRGKSFKVTYQIAAPGGTWDAADNGVYNIALQANQVRDTSRNFIRAKSLGTFSSTVSSTISSAVDTLPTAKLESQGYFTSNRTTFDFYVTYSDDKAIDGDSLSNEDILVTGPNGFSQLARGMGVNALGSGTPRKVRYRFTAPGGAWDVADNGSYSIALQANQVKDSGGNFATAQTLGAFPLTISAAPESEKIAPTASLSAAKVTARGNTYDFTVTYTDDVAVDEFSIDSNDVTVVDRKGSVQQVEKVSVSGSGNSYIATYRIQAPGGTWDRPDNGAYNIVVQPNQIKDINDNSVASSTIGSFLVDVPLRGAKASQSSNSDKFAEDFVLDVNTSTGVVQNFEFTRTEPKSPETSPIRLKFDSSAIKVASSVDDLLSQDELKDSYYLQSYAKERFVDSKFLYFVKFKNYRASLPDGSPATWDYSSNVLVFGVKTSMNSSNPLSLLDIALNGTSSTTEIEQVRFVIGYESFNIEELK